MSYRRYDPETEYWADGQDDDFTFYKPVKTKKPKFVMREPEERKDFKSPYGTTHQEKFRTNSDYSSKSNSRYEGSSKYGRGYENYENQYPPKRSSSYTSSSSKSSKNSGRTVYRSKSNFSAPKVYSSKNNNNPKKKTSTKNDVYISKSNSPRKSKSNIPSSEVYSSKSNKPRTSKSKSAVWKYGENTKKLEKEEKKEIPKKEEEYEYDGILLEEDSDSESDSDNEFVLRTSQGYEKSSNSSSNYGFGDYKKKNDSVKMFSPTNNSNPTKSSYDSSGYRRKVITSKNISPQPPKNVSSSSREFKRYSPPIKNEKINKPVKRNNNYEVPPKKTPSKKKEQFVIPPKRFDKIFFQELNSTPILLVQTFRGIIKKHAKRISPPTKNRLSDIHDSHDNQANMIQILRKTPILVSSYPAQVIEIEKNLKTNPNDAESLKKLVLCQATLKNYREARRAIQQVLSIVPRDPLVYDFLSIINEEEGKITDALSNLEKLIEYDPKNAEKNRGRHRRLLTQWFQNNDSEPKLPLNSQSREMSEWVTFAKRVIQYWEEQISDDKDDDEEEEEEEEEMEGENINRDPSKRGDEKQACALMECIYYGLGCRKLKLAIKCCNRLIKWLKSFTNILDGTENERKNDSSISYIFMCKAFCRLEMNEHKQSLDDSNRALKNLEVVDDLLVKSKLNLLKAFEEHVKSRSNSRDLLKDHVPYELMLVTEKINLMDTLKISLDSQKKKDIKISYLQERIILFIDVLKQPTLALPDLEKVIILDPKNEEFYYMRSNVYEKLGQKKKALYDAQMADKLTKGQNFKHFARRLELSSDIDPSTSLKINNNNNNSSSTTTTTTTKEKKNNNNKKKEVVVVVDPLFERMLGITDRLRKMESGDNLSLIDYMNIDSVPQGSLDQASHFLVKVMNRKYFGKVNTEEFISHVQNIVKKLKFSQNQKHLLNVCGYRKFSNESLGICYEYIPESILLENFIKEERERQRRRKPYEYLSSLEKWDLILQISSVIKIFHNHGIILRNISSRSLLAHPQQDISSIHHQSSFIQQQQQQQQPKIILKWFDLTYAIVIDRNKMIASELLHPHIEHALEKKEKYLRRYKAPETIFDQKYSKKSDIFSLGMLIYSIVTSFEPWKDISDEEVLYKIRSGELPTQKQPSSKKQKNKEQKQFYPGDIEGEFNVLIERCLKSNSNERPSAKEVYEYAQKKKQAHILKQQIRFHSAIKEEERKTEKRRQKKLLKEKEILELKYLRKEKLLEEQLIKKESKVKELEKEKRSIIIKSKKEMKKKEKKNKAEKNKKKVVVVVDKVSQETEKTMNQMKSVCRSLENLRNLFQCPISLDLFSDPMLVVESGGVYEKSAINRWLKKHRTDPISNQVLLSKKRVPLKHLKNIIEEWKKTQSILKNTQF